MQNLIITIFNENTGVPLFSRVRIVLREKHGGGVKILSGGKNIFSDFSILLVCLIIFLSVNALLYKLYCLLEGILGIHDSLLDCKKYRMFFFFGLLIHSNQYCSTLFCSQI